MKTNITKALEVFEDTLRNYEHYNEHQISGQENMHRISQVLNKEVLEVIVSALKGNKECEINGMLQPQGAASLQALRVKLMQVKERLANAAAIENERAIDTLSQYSKLHKTRSECYLQCLQLINELIK